MLGLRGVKSLKLISRIITFELTEPIRPRYVNVTDGRTDGRMPYAIPRFALRASRSKNGTVLRFLLPTVK